MKIVTTNRTRAAFTMLEVTIAAVLVGICAVVIISKSVTSKEKYIIAEAKRTLSAVQKAQKLYKLEHGTYATSNNQYTSGDPLSIEIPVSQYFTHPTLANNNPQFVAIVHRRNGYGESVPASGIGYSLCVSETGRIFCCAEDLAGGCAQAGCNYGNTYDCR